jgi:hypothetical protein
LRAELEKAAANQPGYVPYSSIILFNFLAENDGADGVAARVFVMRDTGTEDVPVDARYTYQNMESKRSVGENATFSRKVFTSAELKARIKAGEGYESVVHANLTYVSSATRSKLLLPLLS